MSKFVFINVQGISDISVKILDSEKELEEYIKDFFCDDEDEFQRALDELTPYGEMDLDDQTLKVVKIK